MTQPLLRNLRPTLASMDTRIAQPALKQADPELLTAEHRAWRQAVLTRADWRCEAVEHGVRCNRTGATHRLFADHINERKDGGAALDVGNGQCLCSTHHARKTATTRARRMARRT